MKPHALLAAFAALASVAAPVAAAPILNPGNGHYYEFVSSGLSFDSALADAASRSYLGRTGHLATVTSADELAFIFNNVTTTGVWFAGTDRDVEGTWTWVAGPEAGTVFWKDGLTLTYSAWSGGEPNNAGNEDYLWGNWSGSAWNDIGGTQLGYVVEFSADGAVPEPASWALMIGGFGLAGAALRRRRSLATA